LLDSNQAGRADSPKNKASNCTETADGFAKHEKGSINLDARNP